uniref:C2H2-type domain-containing protein n=1 Tax=Glossina brevipalpis TaxID=37001 RepID=A0A1A9WGX2_9MUSC
MCRVCLKTDVENKSFRDEVEYESSIKLSDIFVKVTNIKCTCLLDAYKLISAVEQAEVEINLLLQQEHEHSEDSCVKGVANLCGISTISSHLRRHSGENPYKCVVCLKGFPRSHVLVIHGRKHTEEKRYVCSVCDKSFGRSNTLLRHTRTHAGERSHKCTKCTRSFVQSSDRLKSICGAILARRRTNAVSARKLLYVALLYGYIVAKNPTSYQTTMLMLMLQLSKAILKKKKKINKIGNKRQRGKRLLERTATVK